MRKINVLMLLGIVSIFVFSCSHGLLKEPRLYNAKKTEKSAMAVAPEPELQLTGGVDTFDNTDQWYNNPNANGDESNPDKEDFPHTDFETMSLVGTYFNDSNVPVYAMRHENVWVSKDATKAEFVHAKAPDTEGQGYGISNVHWYQYRGRNPVYAADGNYNYVLQFTAKGNPKLSRFYFYRFTGDTLSPSLDNFLFAVDSYSKFMFAFAKPTASKSVFGNNVPTAWGPTDGSAFLGTNYQFYMYDPVGYVEKVDGKYNVVMYDWFKNNLAKGEYQPTLGGLDDKSQGTVLTKVAEKKPDGQGTSPFNNHTVNFFEENMKLLHGKVFQRREKSPEELDGLILYRYTVDNEGKIITRTAESYDPMRSTEEELKTVTYEVSVDKTSEGSATRGLIQRDDGTVGAITIENESHQINLTCGTKEEIIQDTSLFTDPGPAFQLRVGGKEKGRTYKNSKYKYVFSQDGLSVEYYDNPEGEEPTETWTLNGGEGNNAESTYKGSGLVFKFWGMRLSSNDTVLYVTTGQGSTIYETLHLRSWGDPLYLEREQRDTFDKTVAGTSFDVREKETDGRWGRYLWTWSFSPDGKKATLKKTPWNGAPEDVTTVNITSTDAKNGTGGGYTFKLDDALKKLTVSGGTSPNGSDTFEFGYSDTGPHFLWRVAGATFVGDYGYTVYEFSSDGKRLTWKYRTTYLSSQTTEEFDYVEDPNNLRTASYGKWRIGFYGADDNTIKCDNASSPYEATRK